MNIKYLRHNEISKSKWDRCISLSFNGIVYAYSWYLDIVSYGWGALVLDDYKAVMPLTTKSNYALNKIVQPAYAPQLGVFTANKLNVDTVNAFLSAIPAKFKSVQINLNTFNKASHKKFNIKQGITYELDLIVPYKTLYKKFTGDTRLHINKSKKQKINVVKHVNLKDLLLLKKNSSDEPLSFEHMNILRRIIPFCNNHNIGETFGAYNDKNELVAGAFFIKSHHKSVCLLLACTNDGKKAGADYALYNHYINEYAEKNLTLDFGSYYVGDKQHIGTCFNSTPVNFNKLKKSRFLWFFNKI